MLVAKTSGRAGQRVGRRLDRAGVGGGQHVGRRALEGLLGEGRRGVEGQLHLDAGVLGLEVAASSVKVSVSEAAASTVRVVSPEGSVPVPPRQPLAPPLARR